MAEHGYVYIYVSNKEVTPVEFMALARRSLRMSDDFNVTHTKTPVIQSNDYYPFGLTFNNYQRENNAANLYKYNGKEEQDELALNWTDYCARMYQADIGRWVAIDPLAEKMRRWSPYSYAFSNPMRFVDPDGLEPSDPNTPTVKVDKENSKVVVQERTVQNEKAQTKVVRNPDGTQSHITTNRTTVTDSKTTIDKNGNKSSESTSKTTTSTTVVVTDRKGVVSSSTTKVSESPVQGNIEGPLAGKLATRIQLEGFSKVEYDLSGLADIEAMLNIYKGARSESQLVPFVNEVNKAMKPKDKRTVESQQRIIDSLRQKLDSIMSKDDR